ncbi:MAG: 3-oxoacyl-[acyl-carrier-protein] synthase III C-terminal domain-containing protein [Patescibacteria group bacterium]|nr:3-oxoacyl-[acyl-carrier-protein] synthase III C-terminal domain-containing protein [Patescibacteria group bacterium]MDD5715328.1 3-oxoacyl-[acyl-carrier-protein] synthase III C-terminal domain-containing protein [Patescibacteria group bacterium]
MAVPNVFGVKIVSIAGDDLGPETILTNDRLASELLARRKTDAKLLHVKQFPPEIAERYETSGPWIEERLQIRQRRIAPAGLATSDLAIQAGKKALSKAGVTPDQIGSLRIATVTPDYHASSPTASLVAEGLGIPIWDIEDTQLHELIACDHQLACSSFVAALQDAVDDIMLGRCEYALVIGADKMSTITDWSDRGFCPILGDGAGAILLKRVPYEETDIEVNAFYAGGDWTKASRIIAPVGGSRTPLTVDLIKKDPLFSGTKLHMDGNTVFKELVRFLKNHVIPEALEKCGYTPSSINVIFPHQANGRITDAFERPLRALGFTGYVSRTIETDGNTTSASVPRGMVHAYENKILLPGRTVMIVVMGGGYFWRVVFLRWSLK